MYFFKYFYLVNSIKKKAFSAPSCIWDKYEKIENIIEFIWKKIEL